ncbi:MAG: hypothetical protein ACXABY_08255 [Candidatus Thorarchaeota archaeon]|jgi:hypothetical protein
MTEGVAIVGHGPSLRGAGKGKHIDSFEYVARFPYTGDWQTPEDYGTKTSFICSTVLRATKIRPWPIPTDGYYIWSKEGRDIGDYLKTLISQLGGEDVTSLIGTWQKRMATHHYLSVLSRGSDGCFSHGTAAVCIMAARLREPITILGCDSLKRGGVGGGIYSGSWVYENRKREQNNHALDAERLLIDKISEYYKIGVEFI